MNDPEQMQPYDPSNPDTHTCTDLFGFVWPAWVYWGMTKEEYRAWKSGDQK